MTSSNPEQQPEQPSVHAQQQEAIARYHDRSEKLANVEMTIYKVVGIVFLVFVVALFLLIAVVFY